MKSVSVAVRKLFSLALLVIGVALLYKAAMWSYDSYRDDSPGPTQQEILDVNKDCRMNADTGSCICRHKQTRARLDVSYEECRDLALNPR